MSLRVLNIQVRHMNEKCPCFDLFLPGGRSQLEAAQQLLLMKY